MLEDNVTVSPRYVNSAAIPGPVRVYTQEEIEQYLAERENKPIQKRFVEEKPKRRKKDSV